MRGNKNTGRVRKTHTNLYSYLRGRAGGVFVLQFMDIGKVTVVNVLTGSSYGTGHSVNVEMLGAVRVRSTRAGERYKRPYTNRRGRILWRKRGIEYLITLCNLRFSIVPGRDRAADIRKSINRDPLSLNERRFYSSCRCHYRYSSTRSIDETVPPRFAVADAESFKRIVAPTPEPARKSNEIAARLPGEWRVTRTVG